ncbi:hypothetical protein BH23VER1_BH23VER1_24030 [soil metagenome]
MRTATVREAQHHLSKLLQELESGEDIVLTRRGQKIATLSAYRESDQSEIAFPDFGQLRRDLGTDSIKGQNAILQMREESE